MLNSELKRLLFSTDLASDKKSGSGNPAFGIIKFNSLDFTITPASSLNRFTLTHFTRGKGSFKLAMEEYDLKEKSIYFGYPGQIISNIQIRDAQGYLIHADADFMIKTNPALLDYRIFRLFGKKHELVLNNVYNDKLLALYSEMLAEFKDKKFNSEEIIQTLVLQHVLVTDRIMHESNVDDDKELHPKVRAFFAMLNLKGVVNTPVSEYAEALNISPNYLSELVKESTGKTVKTLLKEKTIRQACVLLIHTEMDVKEIAYQLGYNYPQYFDNDFKKTMNLTPLAYRESHR